MDVKIEASWKEKLRPEFEKDYFQNLVEFVKKEYKNGLVYPPGKLIFNALEHCSLYKIKVVIIVGGKFNTFDSFPKATLLATIR